jgi:GNAT superfamily N-acetyltransferase
MVLGGDLTMHKSLDDFPRPALDPARTPHEPIALFSLRDATLVTVRPMRESDGAHIRALYEAMSPTSRYRRFMGSRGALKDAEVAYFTHADQHAHVAFLAVVHDANGEEIPVGAARFVRGSDDPTVAEPAVAVADAWHHRGVGSALLLRLLATATSDGIAMFRAHVHANNDPMRQLLHKWHGELRVEVDGPEVTYEVSLRRFAA